MNEWLSSAVLGMVEGLSPVPAPLFAVRLQLARHHAQSGSGF